MLWYLKLLRLGSGLVRMESSIVAAPKGAKLESGRLLGLRLFGRKLGLGLLVTVEE